MVGHGCNQAGLAGPRWTIQQVGVDACREVAEAGEEHLAHLVRHHLVHHAAHQHQRCCDGRCGGEGLLVGLEGLVIGRHECCALQVSSCNWKWKKEASAGNATPSQGHRSRPGLCLFPLPLHPRTARGGRNEGMCWIVFRGEEDSSTCDHQTRPDQIRPGADRKQPTTRHRLESGHRLDASPPFFLFCPSLLPCQAMCSRLGVFGLDLAKSKGGLLTCCVAIRRVGCTRPCGW